MGTINHNILPRRPREAMSYEKRLCSGSSVWNTSKERQTQEGNRNTKGGWGSSSKMGGMAEGRGLRILGKSSQGGFGFCTEGCATSGRLVCSTLALEKKQGNWMLTEIKRLVWAGSVIDLGEQDSMPEELSFASPMFLVPKVGPKLW